MKKALLSLLPAALMLLTVGCTPEKNWDYPNDEITITLVNSAGEDMLYRQSDILQNAITIEYDGKTFRMGGLTRADGPDLPEWKGLVWKGSVSGRIPNRLVFGEFSVDTKQYRRETFTIDWGDGNRNVIEFDLYSTSNGKKDEPTIHYATWVDGKVNSASSLNAHIQR